ncbi:beta-propeller fold lactonase family protein [Cupriavidus basilensis]
MVAYSAASRQPIACSGGNASARATCSCRRTGGAFTWPAATITGWTSSTWRAARPWPRCRSATTRNCSTSVPTAARSTSPTEEDGLLSAYDIASGKRVFAIKVGEEPEGVKASPDGKRVYVTSEVANLVHVIDVASRKLIKEHPGRQPPAPACWLAMDGKELWVTNELAASVSVIRTDTLEVVQTIAFTPKGFRAEGRDSGRADSQQRRQACLYRAGRANRVAVVDVAERRVLDYVLVGRRAWGLALTRDNALLYVANGLSDDVSVVDTASNKAVTTLKAGRVPHSVAIDD